MTVQRQKQFKLIAFLLQYPDDALMRSLPEISEAIAAIDDPRARGILQRFSAWLQNTPLIELQEQYTASFDMAPDTCLNLTYHLLGDDAERGRALSALQQVYDRAVKAVNSRVRRRRAGTARLSAHGVGIPGYPSRCRQC